MNNTEDYFQSVKIALKRQLLYNQVLRIIKIAVKSDVKDGRI